MKSKLLMILLILSLLIIFTGCPPTEEIKEKVATPVITPSGGTYSTVQNVTITCATEGATIYFTLDGTDPTTSSSKYDGQTIFVTGGYVKAIATKDGYENSDIASAFFLITVGNISTDFPWTRFVGDSLNDYAEDIAMDSQGNIYVTGRTENSFQNATNNGKYDIFITKYDYKGTICWTKLRGGTENEGGNALAVDSSGNVYIVGYTESNFDSNTMKGKDDIVVIKYDTNGNFQWTKFFGGADVDEAYDIVLDSSNNLYITGYTKSSFNSQTNNGEDAFIIKLNSDGTHIWTKFYHEQADERGYGITIDSNNNIYISGGLSNDGFTTYSDFLLIKTNSAGTKEWSITEDIQYAQVAYKVAHDSSNNIYIVGYTEKNFYDQSSLGGKDIFIIKYSSDHNRIWTRILGGSNDDYGKNIYIDSNDNIYMIGHTKSSFNNNTNSGGFDVVILKYDKDGNQIFTKFKGGTLDDGGYGIIVNGTKIYFTGSTKSSFDGYTNKGLNDIFISKILQQ